MGFWNYLSLPHFISLIASNDFIGVFLMLIEMRHNAVQLSPRDVYLACSANRDGDWRTGFNCRNTVKQM